MKHYEDDKYYRLLDSVGCYIDGDGFTYPSDEQGNPDLSNPFHIADIEEDEWFNTLSQEDIDTVCKIREGCKALEFYLNREVKRMEVK